MSSSPFFLRIERREQIRDFHVIVTDPVVLNLEQLLVNDLYRWDLNTITLIFYNICLLINDLHANNYVYSNLLAKNILFSPNMQPYLTDMYKVVEAELNQVKVPKPPENH